MDGGRFVSCTLSGEISLILLTLIPCRSFIHPAQQLYDAPLTKAASLTVDTDILRQDWKLLSMIRGGVQRGLEHARSAGHVGSSLQCSVIINIQGADDKITNCLARYKDELADILVVSSATINQAIPETTAWSVEEPLTELDTSGVATQVGTITVLPPIEHKCSRCWKYVAPKEDGLCNRCDEVVASLPQL